MKPARKGQGAHEERNAHVGDEQRPQKADADHAEELGPEHDQQPEHSGEAGGEQQLQRGAPGEEEVIRVCRPPAPAGEKRLQEGQRVTHEHEEGQEELERYRLRCRRAIARNCDAVTVIGATRAEEHGGEPHGEPGHAPGGPLGEDIDERRHEHGDAEQRAVPAAAHRRPGSILLRAGQPPEGEALQRPHTEHERKRAGDD